MFSVRSVAYDLEKSIFLLLEVTGLSSTLLMQCSLHCAYSLVLIGILSSAFRL